LVVRFTLTLLVCAPHPDDSGSRLPGVLDPPVTNFVSRLPSCVISGRDSGRGWIVNAVKINRFVCWQASCTVVRRHGRVTSPPTASRGPVMRSGAPRVCGAASRLPGLQFSRGCADREQREARRRRDHQPAHLCRRRGGTHRAYDRRCLPRRLHYGRTLRTIAYDGPTLGVSRPSARSPVPRVVSLRH